MAIVCASRRAGWLILFTTGHLEVWHLYITAFISGTFQGFQWPAYSAAISTMLDKKDYTRANAMLDIAGNSSAIFAPMIAGALLAPLSQWMGRNLPGIAAQTSGQPGLTALLGLDLLSAAFAIGTLLCVSIPQPETSQIGRQAEGTFWRQAAFGFRYILSRPSLLGLQLIFMIGNFFHSLGFSVRAPMILARTGSDELVFGSVQMAGAIGGLVGGLAVGAWGGFKRRVHGVLIGWILGGLAMAATGAARSLAPWLVVAFAGFLLTPLINASNQAIWQAKVAPDVQGRVFATRRLIAWLVSPVSQLAAGPLADDVFEPRFGSVAMQGTLFERVFGIGAGAGMGLQMAIAGIFATLVGLSGYLFPAVREAEIRLPDHDQPGEPKATAAATAAG